MKISTRLAHSNVSEHPRRIKVGCEIPCKVPDGESATKRGEMWGMKHKTLPPPLPAEPWPTILLDFSKICVMVMVGSVITRIIPQNPKNN